MELLPLSCTVTIPLSASIGLGAQKFSMYTLQSYNSIFESGLFLDLGLLFHYFGRWLRLLRLICCRVWHSRGTSFRVVSFTLRVMRCTFVTANIIERWQVASTSFMNRDRAFLNFNDVGLIRLMFFKFSHELVFVQVRLESKYFLCNLLVVSLNTF